MAPQNFPPLVFSPSPSSSSPSLINNSNNDNNDNNNERYLSLPRRPRSPAHPPTETDNDDEDEDDEDETKRTMPSVPRILKRPGALLSKLSPNSQHRASSRLLRASHKPWAASLLQRLPIISHLSLILLVLLGPTHAPYLLAAVFLLTHVVFAATQVRLGFGMLWFVPPLSLHTRFAQPITRLPQLLSLHPGPFKNKLVVFFPPRISHPG